MEQKQSKGSIPTLLAIIFLDMLGIGVIIPILPLIFLQSSILPSTVSIATRLFLLGLLVATYPIMQFFGAPILGVLSDNIGRKKVLLLSLGGTFVGYILFALGIVYGNIYLLFFSRAVDGFTGGNFSVVQSAIVDVSTKENKVKNLGLIGMMFGFGFIIGPYVGGKLADPSFVSWFSAATPFWFSAVLCALNITAVSLFFKETLKERQNRKITPFTGFSNLKKAFSMKALRVVFISFFLLNFGWTFYTQFSQIFLYDKFSFTASQIGDFFAYVGLWIALAQGLIIRRVSGKVQPYKILFFSLLAVPLVILTYLLPSHAIWLYVIVPFLAVSFGFCMPNFSALISNATAPEAQGEIMGIQASIMAAAQAIPPVLAGLSLSLSTSMPIILSSTCIGLAWVIFVFFFNPLHHTFKG